MRSSDTASIPIGVALEIMSGKPQIESCDIGLSGNCALLIIGKGTDPTIQNCTIHDGGRDTISIADFVSPIINGCIITNAQHSAVKIANACVVISHTTISNSWSGNTNLGLGYGIYVDGVSEGDVNNSSIGPCGNSGAFILQGNFLFDDDTIHDIDRDGVTLERDSHCEIKASNIYNCKWTGVGADGCCVTLTNVKVHGSGGSGILGLRGASLVLTQCNVYNSGTGDYSIQQNSTLVRN